MSTPSPSNSPQSSPPRVEVVFDQLLGTLQVPTNIDPTLIDIWLDKERRELHGVESVTAKKSSQRGLVRILAVYFGVVAMLLVTLLGLIRGMATIDILNAACFALLGFSLLGYLSGMIIEFIIRESVETTVREVVRRSDLANTE